jgi:hypothetical protein
VFVPANKDTTRFFKKNGFNVFIAVNVFGGTSSWNKYPDARPVKSDGALLGKDASGKIHGGVCPSHNKWRVMKNNDEGFLLHALNLFQRDGLSFSAAVYYLM